ncbi:hypothetical protein [Hymenobacter crusticola]|uniref:DUF4890 domain-containing protein n=1 Tax=Hymenobacter crusticola TaxID=1770526 RepID=A0A243WJS3_9BACT|nr:hypothetical protein [Hymenobacter crusticola]OUJ75870.1 hypothetical protein BXP70_00810 [Hymenobacter crusticola]
MSGSRSLLFLALLTSLTFGCARRRRADIPEARTSVAVAPAPAPAVAPTAARDLTDVMTDELNLTSAQQTKVRAILNGTVEQVNGARQQYGSNQTALMTELRRINASSEAQLKAALTPTQYKQYVAKKRQMQAQMQARKAGN